MDKFEPVNDYWSESVNKSLVLSSFYIFRSLSISNQQFYLDSILKDNLTSQPLAKFLYENSITNYIQFEDLIKNRSLEKGIDPEVMMNKLRQFSLLFETSVSATDLDLPLDESLTKLSEENINISIKLLLFLHNLFEYILVLALDCRMNRVDILLFREVI